MKRFKFSSARIGCCFLFLCDVKKTKKNNNKKTEIKELSVESNMHQVTVLV